MQPMYYIGLDVHKRKISYCVKDGSGRIHAEGSISATRLELDHWMRSLPQPWSAAMEATMFTGWIYDHLKPHASTLKVAHPLMLRAIAVAKKKTTASMPARSACLCSRISPNVTVSSMDYVIHQEGNMHRERALKIVLVLVGLLFSAGVYPVTDSLLHANQSMNNEVMMLSLYVALGIFLLVQRVTLRQIAA